MSVLSKMTKTVLSTALGLAIAGGSVAMAEVKIRVQSVIPAKADEVHMLNEFAADVAALTNNCLLYTSPSPRDS